MCSVWSSTFRVMMVPQLRHYGHKKNHHFLILLPHFNLKMNSILLPIYSSSTNDDNSVPSSILYNLGYDPSEELFGLAVDLQPRMVASAASKPRSWFGPNGLYIRELPCPSCRGRGYTPCEECGIERSRPDCSLCTGEGIITCHQCLGDRVIWEESIDEQPWEEAHSISPLKVKEDDEVDNLDIKLDVRKKNKRGYKSSTPEVNLKISRSLKSLNERTGIFSNRMKLIHEDPMLRAQRVAAIKKSKGTDSARKHASETMKSYFSDPENRHKRSISMQGVKFRCRNCGKEGHRRNYCPEIQEKSEDRRFRCRECGEKGHNRRTCKRLQLHDKERSTVQRNHSCKICGQTGHNKRTCPQLSEVEPATRSERHGKYSCSICQEKGHNKRTYPRQK